MNKIKIALTKGRLEKKAITLFKAMGFDCNELINKGRRLILPVNDYDVVLVKSTDVITYVGHGVCDIGIVGKDTIVESEGGFYEVMDLKTGICTMSLACKKDFDFYGGYNIKRIATKYPKCTADFFGQKDMDVQIIKIDGSVELAPLLDLADGIVDIVETGATLRENGLAVIEEIMPISARVIVNPASLKLRKNEIDEFLKQLEIAKEVNIT